MVFRTNLLGALVVVATFITTPVQAVQLTDAAAEGDVELVSQLIAEGADVNAPGPMIRASENGHAEVISLLLAAGANVNAGLGSPGVPALYFASQSGHAEVISLLLASGADVNASIFTGETALHAASRGGHAEVISLLLASGADVNAQDDEGRVAYVKPSPSNGAVSQPDTVWFETIGPRVDYESGATDRDDALLLSSWEIDLIDTLEGSSILRAERTLLSQPLPEVNEFQLRATFGRPSGDLAAIDSRMVTFYFDGSNDQVSTGAVTGLASGSILRFSGELPFPFAFAGMLPGSGGILGRSDDPRVDNRGYMFLEGDQGPVTITGDPENPLALVFLPPDGLVYLHGQGTIEGPDGTVMIREMLPPE